MNVAKLHEAVQTYAKRTNEKMTFRWLATKAGRARSTFEPVATRQFHNAELRTTDKRYQTLGWKPAESLSLPNNYENNGSMA